MYVNTISCAHLYGLPQVFDFLCFQQSSGEEALHSGSEVTQRPLLLRCYPLRDPGPGYKQTFQYTFLILFTEAYKL